MKVYEEIGTFEKFIAALVLLYSSRNILYNNGVIEKNKKHEVVKLAQTKAVFKTIQFRRGFNIIIADRDQDSSDKHSTNGLGKTLLLEIVNYCLGGKPSKTLKKRRDEKLGIQLDY